MKRLSQHTAVRPLVWGLGTSLALGLAGCDYLGIQPASQAASEKLAEGKAIGGACRHANRALEDCYTLNPKANKAAMFEGWREMDGYMRENNLEAIKPSEPPPAAAAPKKPPAPTDGEDETEVTEETPAKPAAKQ